MPAGRLNWYDLDRHEHKTAYRTGEDFLDGFSIRSDDALYLFTHDTINRWNPVLEISVPVAEIAADT